jgi:hypothetical protein
MTEETSAQLLQISREARSSIELTVDAKRVYRWTLKKYHGDDRADIDTAIEDLRHADERLRNLFGTAGEESLGSLPY